MLQSCRSRFETGVIGRIARASILGLTLAALATPALAMDALLVSSSSPPPTGDLPVVARLQGLGFTVTVVDDDVVQESDSLGKNLILISSSVNSGKVGDTFLFTPIPLINWEAFLHDDLDLTGGTPGTDFGNSNSSSLAIVGSHPLTAGLSGTVAVTTNVQQVTYGVPAPGAIIAATFPVNPGLSPIFAYEAGQTMLTYPAPARRIGFFFRDNSPGVATASGFSLFDAAVLWAVGGGGNQPPFVTANDGTAETGATVPLTATVVDDGNPVPATVLWTQQSGPAMAMASIAAPTSINTTVTFPLAGTYVLELTADDTELMGDDTATFVVSDPGSGPLAELLLVSGSPGGTASDLLIAARLESQGYAVTVVDDDGVQASAADQKDAILISKSVVSGKVGNTFTSTPIPLVTWEPWLFDNLGMTGTAAGTAFGDVANQQSIDVAATGHPLTAGLSGNTAVTNSARNVGFGVPAAGAIVAANVAGNATRAAIFGFDIGQQMLNSSAPARRVGFFFDDSSPSVATPAGLALFDAVVPWLLDQEIVNQPPSVTVNGAAGEVGQTIALNGSAFDDGMIDPLSLLWEQISGPPMGTATIAQPNQAATTATFDVPGTYVLRLTADDGEFTSDDMANFVIVPQGSTPPAILFVSGAAGGTAGDNLLVARLQSNGYDVMVVDDDGVQASAAIGKDLVVVSSTVLSGKVGNVFTPVAVPVVTWEPYIFDNLDMTGPTAGVDYGQVAGQQALAIVGTHPLTAGLSGTVEVSTAARNARFGVPAAGAIIAANLANNPARAAIFGFLTGQQMQTSTAPARRVAFHLDDDGAQVATPAGLSLFDAAIQFGLNSGNTAPEVTTTSGTAEVGQTVALTASIMDDGIAGPVTFSWTQMNGPFGGTATISDPSSAMTMVSFDTPGTYMLKGEVNDTEFTDTATATFVVNAVPVGLEILFVTGTIPLPLGDAAVIEQLELWGFSVTVVEDVNAVLTDADGVDLIMISATVQSSAIGGLYAATPVPLVTSESFIFDDMGMTSAQGAVLSQNAIDMVGSHPLTAGLTGTVQVYRTTNLEPVLWGTPSASAVIAATVAGDPSKAAVFGYETGAMMANGTAPARRVGYYFPDDTGFVWTANSVSLLRSIVLWALDEARPPLSRILALGDSITGGAPGGRGGFWSYRDAFYNLLAADLCEIDMTGTLNGPDTGAPGPGFFDRDHNGHATLRTDEILAQIPNWLLGNAPDYAVVHLGTNDVMQMTSLPDAKENLRAIIAELRFANPSVVILLAQVIPGLPSLDAATDTLNGLIADLVTEETTVMSPVLLVDLHTGYDNATDNFDDIHPNVSGQDKIANGFFDSLRPLLGGSCSGGVF